MSLQNKVHSITCPDSLGGNLPEAIGGVQTLPC